MTRTWCAFLGVGGRAVTTCVNNWFCVRLFFLDAASVDDRTLMPYASRSTPRSRRYRRRGGRWQVVACEGAQPAPPLQTYWRCCTLSLAMKSEVTSLECCVGGCGEDVRRSSTASRAEGAPLRAFGRRPKDGTSPRFGWSRRSGVMRFGDDVCRLRRLEHRLCGKLDAEHARV